MAAKPLRKRASVGPIPFHKAYIPPKAMEYLQRVFESSSLAGDAEFSRQCVAWMEKHFGQSCLLTSSGTHSLELAAILLELKPGDEVILPSFTFSSTANAFALR